MDVTEATRRAEERDGDPSSISVYSATGGTRVTPQELSELRAAVLASAREYGFPAANRKDTQKCEAHIAVTLYRRMDITANEAASEGLWEYLTCVLMPDIVIWRFRDSGGTTSVDRFLGGRRNNFHRLWWRAYVLAGNLDDGEAVRLLGFLGEDEMVQMLERPGLFGNLRLMRVYCSEFRRAVAEGEIKRRRADINRDVHKRLLRLTAIRAMGMLPEDVLREELRDLIRQSERSLVRGGIPGVPEDAEAG